jgi:hypothetical protein
MSTLAQYGHKSILDEIAMRVAVREPRTEVVARTADYRACLEKVGYLAHEEPTASASSIGCEIDGCTSWEPLHGSGALIQKAMVCS